MNETMPPRLIVACMGGWCGLRDDCLHFDAPTIRLKNPAERLCDYGHERTMFFVDKVRRTSSGIAL